MPRSRTRVGKWAWFTALTLALLPGCSHGGSGTGASQFPAFSVLEVSPPDGATGVPCRAEVSVVFSEPVFGLTLNDITVEDTAGPLGGMLVPGPEARTWRWLPVRDLPRGATLRVRLDADVRSASGARPATTEIASFRVLDHSSRSEYLLGNVIGDHIAALAWPFGQLAAVVGHDYHDLSHAPVVATALPMNGDLEAVASDEVGDFALIARSGNSPFVSEAVHGLSTGNALLTATSIAPAVAGRVELCANARGDFATYIYGIQGEVAYERLLLSPMGSLAWFDLELRAAGLFPLRHIALDGSGNVFAAVVDVGSGRLLLQRHDRQLGTSAEFDVAGLPVEFAVGAMGNGEARVFWKTHVVVGGVEQQVRLCRRFRDGVLLPPQELMRGERVVDLTFRVAQGGAAVAVVRSLDDERWYLQRFEVDGQVGTLRQFRTGALAPAYALALAPRGEAWLVWVETTATGDELRAIRSRVSLEPEQPTVLYRAEQAAGHIHAVAAAVEDAGRVVVVFSEDNVEPQHRVRAIVLQ